MPGTDHTSIEPLNLELGMIRHVDDTEQRIMKRIDDIYERINTTTSELRIQHDEDLRHINDRITNVEHALSNKLDTQTQDIAQHINKLGEKMDARFTKIDTRVTALERWQWTIVGGATVVLFLLSNFLLKYLPFK
jgi:hypothetical protein